MRARPGRPGWRCGSRCSSSRPRPAAGHGQHDHDHRAPAPTTEEVRAGAAGVRRPGATTTTVDTVHRPRRDALRRARGALGPRRRREVRQAYVALARQHHPDRAGGDADAMRAVNDAWATLRDPARRATYDRDAAAAPPTPARPAPEPRARTDLEDLLADLEDDTPLGGQVVLPRGSRWCPWRRSRRRSGCSASAMLFSSPPALLAGRRAVRAVLRAVPRGAVRGPAGVATGQVGSPPTMATYLDRILEQHRDGGRRPIRRSSRTCSTRPGPARARGLPARAGTPPRPASWPSSPRSSAGRRPRATWPPALDPARRGERLRPRWGRVPVGAHRRAVVRRLGRRPARGRARPSTSPCCARTSPSTRATWRGPGSWVPTPSS